MRLPVWLALVGQRLIIVTDKYQRFRSFLNSLVSLTSVCSHSLGDKSAQKKQERLVNEEGEARRKNFIGFTLVES